MKEILSPEIESERINLLFHTAQAATAGLIVAYLSLLFAFKDILEARHIILWSVIFFVILLTRVFTIIYIKRKNSIEPISLKDLQKYETLYAILAFFSGLVFSATLFMPFYSDNLVITMFAVMIMMGLSAGSAISSNASIKVVITFLAVTTFPILFYTLYQGEYYYYLIAFTYAFFSLVLLRITLSGNKVVIENLSLRQKAREESLKDQLTGLWNRRNLELFIGKLIPKSIRDKKTFSIIILDIDFFKKYNDDFGHLKGDEALVSVANVLQNELRENDLAVRFGGEEFLVVLPETDIKMAQEITKRIIRNIRKDTQNTISAGIAVYSENMNFDELVKLADDALYQAKENGRDQFIVGN